MTMTIRERETLQHFVDQSHGVGTLHEIIAVLASVALKHEQIRIAQAAPGSVEIAKCGRCGVDLFPGDDFHTRDDNGASGCWRLFGHEGKPCFRNRGGAASADTHPTGGDSTEIEAPASLSGAVPEGQTPNPSSSPAAGR